WWGSSAVSEKLKILQQRRVDWRAIKDVPYRFETVVDGRVVALRLNDFPEEPLCTVIVDGGETDLDDWPPAWRHPRHRMEGTRGDPPVPKDDGTMDLMDLMDLS